MRQVLERRAVEERALRPTVTPNGNPDEPPSSVGEDVDFPGDPHGLAWGGITPSPWDGWPAEWNTPLWGQRIGELTDTAWTCLDRNSAAVASMPAYLVGSSASLPDDWLENPNPDVYASWWEFMRTLVWDFLLGEAFILCDSRYRNGYPARFHVVEPWLVNVEMERGLRRYDIGGVRVPDGDLLHLRYKTTARDAHGHGPLEVGRYRLIAANALVRYATNLVANGGIPPGILEGDETSTANQAAEVQRQWHDASKSGLIKVTFAGLRWRDVQLSPKDMALTELEQMNAARVATLLMVPPFLVGLPSGDSMTYANATSVYQYHWRTLRTVVDGMMRGMSAWLTPRGTRIELNRDEYIAPTPAEAAQIAATYHGIVDTSADGVETRALTVEEIRAAQRLEGQSPAALAEGVLR